MSLISKSRVLMETLLNLIQLTMWSKTRKKIQKKPITFALKFTTVYIIDKAKLANTLGLLRS